MLSEDLLLYFIAHCHANLHLCFSTIKLYLSSIRFAYLQSGVSNPFHNPDGTPYGRLPSIFRALKKTQRPSTFVRMPITATVLTRMFHILSNGLFTPFTDKMLLCACSFAFYGFLRCGEFTVRKLPFDASCNLCINDVSVSTDKISLRLKVSKADPFRKGVTIHYFRNSPVCPITCFHNYFQVRKALGCAPELPLFVCSDGTPLTRSSFCLFLKQILSVAGLNPEQYSGHSFRIGAATTAAACSIEDHLIKTLGRWSSDCYIRYIRISDNELRHAQQAMSSAMTDRLDL